MMTARLVLNVVGGLGSHDNNHVDGFVAIILTLGASELLRRSVEEATIEQRCSSSIWAVPGTPQ